MNRTLIQAGCTYVAKDRSSARYVDDISNDRVTYRSRRFLYALSASMPLDEFARWAYERQDLAKMRRRNALH